MASRAKKLPRQFVDICVIYASERDKGKWVAHSLETDQIGVGDCIVDALADLLKAIRQILDLADQEGDIAVFREAPARIKRMAETAQPLPREIYEIAHKRVHGEWPEDFEPSSKTPHRRKYKTEIHEAVAS